MTDCYFFSNNYVTALFGFAVIDQADEAGQRFIYQLDLKIAFGDINGVVVFALLGLNQAVEFHPVLFDIAVQGEQKRAAALFEPSKKLFLS
jgi:hypothetical protein